MCDDHRAATPPGEGGPDPSRRQVMHAAAVAGAGVLIGQPVSPGKLARLGRAGQLGQLRRLGLHSAERDVTAGGHRAFSMAMHIHSSFSEQSGSMNSQLFQAAGNSVDVLWWTDHDARMDGLGYRKTVHFTSLTSEPGGPGQRGPWTWRMKESGPLTGRSGGGIVENPCSPNDPVAGGSMYLSAKSGSTALAKFGYYADSHPAGWNYRDNLTGQSLTIDVLLNPGWTRGYLELEIVSSYHEAIGSRPAGDYTLSYRFVPPGAGAGRARHGLFGVITIPVTPTSRRNPWSTVTITPSADIAALWPDLDYRDFALWELTLSAASEGDQVSGYFDYLRFIRKLGGEVFLRQQADMAAVLAPQYPSVIQRQGLEVSWGLPHINWFGGQVSIPDYGHTKLGGYPEFVRRTVIPQIHAAGGLVSYNHPFGYGDPPAHPPAEQDRLLSSVARELLPGPGRRAALGSDLLEVGYHLRQGVDLAHHVALWDILSRNAVFLTGTGTSDDHFGLDWAGIPNNWVTSVWAPGTAEGHLLAALAAGRSWCGSLAGYRGGLDLLVDGACPMGSVSVSRVRSRTLVATATKLPAGGSLQILQGVVDYAGTVGVAADTRVIGRYPAADLVGGAVALSIDTRRDSFVRTEVLNAAGNVIGLSNPVWLLRSKPPGGIPAARAA